MIPLVHTGTPFIVGDRVRVADTYHWKCGIKATVTHPPVRARHVGSTPWDGAVRAVEEPWGTLYFYWVTFDRPECDRQGLGPFSGAEVDARFLGFA